MTSRSILRAVSSLYDRAINISILVVYNTLMPILPNDKSRNLAKLYPTPKTYEERAQEQKNRELRRLRRIPRHLALYAAVRLFIILVLGVFIYALSPVLIMWMFNLVLCVLVLLGLVKWLTGDISAALAMKGLNTTSFYTLYGIVIAPLTAVALHLANTQSHTSTMLLFDTAAFLLHYAAIAIVITLMIRAQD